MTRWMMSVLCAVSACVSVSAAEVKPGPGSGLPASFSVKSRYNTEVIARGLSRPTGIAIDRDGSVVFTEVPMPGQGGGTNGVSRLDLESGEIALLHQGEPEPTDIVAGPAGDLYWTCRSAGVVLHRGPGGSVSVLLRDLDKPMGIALGPDGDELFLTEVPTPGVPSSRGGTNRVSSLALKTGRRALVDFGDPEPTDVAVDAFGHLNWTCSSAGVIVEAVPRRR